MSFTQQVQPYGALSLKSSMPFTLDGTLGLYVRANNLSRIAAGSAEGSKQPGSAGFDLGDLEVQFESSSPALYTITRSYTLRCAQAAACSPFIQAWRWWHLGGLYIA
jgi:hypothetical protein